MVLKIELTEEEKNWIKREIMCSLESNNCAKGNVDPKNPSFDPDNYSTGDTIGQAYKEMKTMKSLWDKLK